MCQIARYYTPALVGAGSEGQLKKPVNARRGTKSKKLNLKVKARSSLLFRPMVLNGTNLDKQIRQWMISLTRME